MPIETQSQDQFDDQLDLVPLAFAPEFLEILQDTGEFALREWLKGQGAPQAVFDLMDGITLLQSYMDSAEAGELKRYQNLSLIDEVPSVVNAIAELGGRFHGPVGISARRAAAIQKLTDAEVEHIEQLIETDLKRGEKDNH